MSESSSKKPRLVGNTSGGVYDGPIEEEDVAKRKLEKAGFEEGNFTSEKIVPSFTMVSGVMPSTPIIYFCGKGDIAMCRYLVSKGASMSDKIRRYWTTMRAAARCGKLETCRWLHWNGVAVYDGETNTGYTTLGLALRTYPDSDNSDNNIAVAKWIILNDGLARDASGEIDASMRSNLSPSNPYAVEVRPQLLSWAESGINNHEAFMTFLSGTLSIPDFSKESFQQHVFHKHCSKKSVQDWIDNSPEHLLRAVWEDMFSKRRSPLRCFSGKSGILERIADFYGLTPTQDLRIFRELAPALRRFILEHPVESVI